MAIDYDPSATAINQENRIKVMLANAGRSSDRRKGKPLRRRSKKTLSAVYKNDSRESFPVHSGVSGRRLPDGTMRNGQRPLRISNERNICAKEREKNMAIERVQAYFRALHMEERIRVLEASSATVELAAQALQCAPERIAKTLSFLVQDDPVLIVAAGDGTHR